MRQKQIKSQSSISVKRRMRERAEMSIRIMNAAREMFVRDGFEAVTLRKIAKAIEYSPAAIYQYFKDKRTLVLEIIRKDSDELRKHLLDSAAGDSPLERIVEMARRYATWGISHPYHYRLMLAPPPAWAEHDIELREQERPPLEQEALSILRQMVDKSIERGEVRDEFIDSSVIASTLWAGIHGLIMLEISMTPKDKKLLGIEKKSFEQRFETLVQVFRLGFFK